MERNIRTHGWMAAELVLADYRDSLGMVTEAEQSQCDAEASTLKGLAGEFFRTQVEHQTAQEARLENDCYGDLPKDRGPHVFGRSEKGLAADIAAVTAADAYCDAKEALRDVIVKQTGLSAEQLRSVFL